MKYSAEDQTPPSLTMQREESRRRILFAKRNFPKQIAKLIIVIIISASWFSVGTSKDPWEVSWALIALVLWCTALQTTSVFRSYKFYKVAKTGVDPYADKFDRENKSQREINKCDARKDAKF